VNASGVLTSLLRTNCKDCLDRTNVVQSLIARHTLEMQARRLLPAGGAPPPLAPSGSSSSLTPSSSTSSLSSSSSSFFSGPPPSAPSPYWQEIDAAARALWLANGDAVSHCYAGSGSMKSSLVKGWKAKLNDGMISLDRCRVMLVFS
jgi:hypothetical protein